MSDDTRPELDLDALEKATRNGADAGMPFSHDCLVLIVALRAERARALEVEQALRDLLAAGGGEDWICPFCGLHCMSRVIFEHGDECPFEVARDALAAAGTT